MRAKWSAPIRKYWKISEQMMVKYCDLTICDSVNKQLKLILKTNKYDLIHCHTPIVGILTRMAARKYRKTGTIVIYTTHGFTFTDKSSKKNWIVYFTAEKLMSRFCDALPLIDFHGLSIAR